MGPRGPKMGVPPKKPLFLRKMPFRLPRRVSDQADPYSLRVPPHDDVVVV